MEENENILTFEELRTVQKRGRSNESLQKLGLNFFDRVKKYLKIKKKLEDQLSNREYENARRIIADILEIRERKIVRLASLSAKTKIPLKNLTPEEMDFLKSIKSKFEDYRNFITEKMGLKEKTEKQENIEEKTEKIKQEKTKSGVQENEEKISSNPIQGKKQIEKTQNREKELENTEKTVKEAQKKEKELEKPENEENKSEKKLHKIKITGNVPKFMGVDLEVYGPYKNGDTAEIPPKNAEVLINQKLAQSKEKVYSQV